MLLIMAVWDGLFDLVAEHEVLANAWVALQNQFQASDTPQVILLSSKLHTTRILGGLVTNNLLNAREMKNKLTSFDKSIEDQTLVELVLNCFLSNYEGMIQALSNHDVMLNLSHVSLKLLIEAHKVELHNK